MELQTKQLKVLTIISVLASLIFLALWVTNSPFLLSPLGILLWASPIGIGLVNIVNVRKKLKYSVLSIVFGGFSFGMVILTVLIYFAVSSM